MQKKQVTYIRKNCGKKKSTRKRLQEARNTSLVLLLIAMLATSMTGCGITVETPDSKEKSEQTVEQDDKTNMDNPILTDEKNQKMNDKEKTTGAVIRPQDDFYGAINKDTLESYNPTYKDMGAGAAYDIQEQVDAETLAMIQDIVTSDVEYEKGSAQILVKDAYQQTLQYLKHGKSIAPQIFEENRKAIQNAKDREQLQAVMKDLISKQGVRLYFQPSIDYNYQTGNSYALYFDQIESVAEISLKDLFEKDEEQEALHGFAKRLLMDFGEDKEVAGQKADDYIYMVLDIASHTDFELEESENPFLAYTYKTNKACDELLAPTNINEIEEVYGFDNPYDGWFVKDEKQLEMLASKFTDENIETIKTFLLCELAMEYKAFLADEYSALSVYATNESAKPEENALIYVNSILPDQVSELYQQYYFTPKMQDDFQRMYEDIIASYEELIRDASWLSEDTREGFLEKLHNIVFVPGGARDTSSDGMVVAKDPFETYCNAKKTVLNRYKKMLGTSIDKNVSVMNSNVVNAGYNPINTFTVTVAIAHAPYYADDFSYSQNLGGLGMVMAHEIGHAFDSTCMVWDENGKHNPDWIVQADRQKMKKQVERFEEYYGSYKILEVYSVDGKQTSGENFADLGAMECVSNIIKTKEENRELFENYARIWCQLSVDTDVVEQIEKDEHSPAVVRTNAVLSSIDAFYEVYGVKEGDGMYKKPEERVYRWREER